MTCPECSTAIATTARFCHNCGWDGKLAAAGKALASAERPAWKRWTVGISLGIASLLVFWLLLIPRGESDAALAVGQPAPDFALQSLDGKRVQLSEAKGRPVIVNFWATWCTPCRKEMPDFQEVYDLYKDKGLLLYGINVGESKVGVSDFVRTVGVSFPILLDEKEAAQNAYKILPLPATFFIDRTGTVRAVYQYQMNRMQIETEVQRILTR